MKRTIFWELRRLASGAGGLALRDCSDELRELLPQTCVCGVWFVCWCVALQEELMNDTCRIRQWFVCAPPRALRQLALRPSVV